MSDYKTCTHLYDDGNRCGSAALTGRDYCGYHLRYRGRLMRRAQYLARHQRFDITLPPLDSLCSIQSALSEIAEALAADMIDPRRAQALLKLLRMSRENLKDIAHWHDTPYRSENTAAYDNFEADYGLPRDLDLSAPPEVAFPPPAEPNSMSVPPLSPAFGDRVGNVGAPPLSPSLGDRVGDIAHPLPLSLDRPPLIPEIPPPVLRDYNAEAEAAMTEVTPQDLELNEILKTQGYKAMERRGREHQRDADRKRQRKLYRANYERYAAEAKVKNIQRAAEKLLKERQAAEKSAASAQTPNAEPSATKKPPMSAANVALQPAQKESEKTA